MADRLSDSGLHAMRGAGCAAAGCTDPAWRGRGLHAPNCVQPDIDWLVAEVRRLTAERDRYLDVLKKLARPADYKMYVEDAMHLVEAAIAADKFLHGGDSDGT
jgi:hypothetical protein